MASSNREAVHRAIDDLSDDEAEDFYKIFTERRKHEEPGLALRAAFVEVCIARAARRRRLPARRETPEARRPPASEGGAVRAVRAGRVRGCARVVAVRGVGVARRRK